MAYGTSTINYSIPFPGDADTGQPDEESKRERAVDLHLLHHRYATGSGALPNDDGTFTQLRLGTVVEAGRWLVKGIYVRTTGTSLVAGLTDNSVNYVFARRGASAPWDSSVSFIAKTSPTEIETEIILGTMSLSSGTVQNRQNLAGLVRNPIVREISASGSMPAMATGRGVEITVSHPSAGRFAASELEADLSAGGAGFIAYPQRANQSGTHGVLVVENVTGGSTAFSVTIRRRGIVDGNWDARLGSASLTFGASFALGGGGAHSFLSTTHDDTAAASGAEGDMVMFTSSRWRRLAVGSVDQVLTVSGGTARWLASALPAHNLLSTGHPDTSPAGAQSGDMVVGSGTQWQRFARGAANTYLKSDGASLVYAGTTHHMVRVNSGANVGARPRTNYVAGPNMTITAVQDNVDDEVDVTFEATTGTAAAHNVLSSTHTDAETASGAEGDLIMFTSSRWRRLVVGATDQVLTVSGGTARWLAPASVAHNLLSTTHPDTTAASVQRGDLITGQGASPAWARLALGTTGMFLRSDGVNARWQPISQPDLPSRIKRIPMAVMTVGMANANAFWEAVDGTNFDWANHRFLDGVTGVVAYWAIVPDDLATTPNWNVILYHTRVAGTGNNVVVNARGRDIAQGGTIDAANTALVSSLAIRPNAAGVMTVTALTTTNFDGAEPIAAGNLLVVEIERLGADAVDELGGDWRVLAVVLRVNVR